jgi:hypothetical protein
MLHVGSVDIVNHTETSYAPYSYRILRVCRLYSPCPFTELLGRHSVSLTVCPDSFTLSGKLALAFRYKYPSSPLHDTAIFDFSTF